MERYSLHKYFYIASKKSHESPSHSQYFENPENNTISATIKRNMMITYRSTIWYAMNQM